MEGKYYRSLGLPLSIWSLVDEAKDTRVSRNFLGRYPADGLVVAWLMKLGMNALWELEAKELRLEELTA